MLKHSEVRYLSGVLFASQNESYFCNKIETFSAQAECNAKASATFHT